MEKVELVIDRSINKIIEETAAKKNINRIKKRHDEKVHFIPKKYRVFTGLLQSMNIKFGDFIEQLFQEIVTNSSNYELEELSGIGRRKFTISRDNDNLVDAYITSRQIDYNATEDQLTKNFIELIKRIDLNCITEKEDDYILTHDIDLFFKEKGKNDYFYAEIKYNDDHDSGKYVDISRKFIKTYAYLHQELLKKYDRDPSKFNLKPCMFFFTNKKMTGNIYLPEKGNIYRGKEIFDNFFTDIKYEDIDNYLSNISEKKETVEKFDNLYKEVMKIV